MKSDRHQVRGRARIHRLYGLVHVPHDPMGRHKGRQVRHRDLLEIQNPGPADPLNVG